MDEFNDELANLRDDLDYLTDDVTDLSDRVGALEEANKRPKAFGWIDYRMGLVTKPNVPKAILRTSSSDDDDIDGRDTFDNLTIKVGIQGQVTDALSARIALKMRDASDRWIWNRGGNSGSSYIPDVEAASSVGSPDTIPGLPSVDGYKGEQIWLDEACLMFNTSRFPKAQWTVGRFFQSYGPGLLVNNDRKSQQGIRMQMNNFLGLPINVEAFGGNVENTFTNWLGLGHDSYISARAEYKAPSFRIAGNYLANGYGGEQGWSADMWARVFGNREIWAEYARQTDAMNGSSISSNNSAIIAAADIWKSTNWGLRGYYSKLEPNFNPWYSTANPYYEYYGYSELPTPDMALPTPVIWGALPSRQFLMGVGPAMPWERWLRNPLAMANLEVIGGQFNVNIANMPVELAYYKLDAEGSNWSNSLWPELTGVTSQVPFDQLWAVKVSREVADGITANLTYARQMAASGVSLKDQNLVMLQACIGF